MSVLRMIAAAALALTLSACSSTAAPSADLGGWAARQQYVVSVDAQGAVAHLVVDGAISDDELAALSAAAWDEAISLGLDSPSINLIVGNAWAFSVDEAGSNVSTVLALRANPVFVGALVDYVPLEPVSGYDGAIRGSVTTQAALGDAYDALAAVSGNQPITAATANGLFTISGTATERPSTAIALLQEIAARVVVTSAAAAAGDPESLDIGVGSGADRATADDIGTAYPAVVLSVRD